jgi:hypothetical protein
MPRRIPSRGIGRGTGHLCREGPLAGVLRGGRGARIPRRARPLRLRNHGLGSINLFALDTGELSNRDTVLVQAMAEIATISIVKMQLVSSDPAGHIRIRHTGQFGVPIHASLSSMLRR